MSPTRRPTRLTPVTLPLLLAVTMLLAPGALSGQQEIGAGIDELPETLAGDVLAFLNDDSILRFEGRATIPEDQLLEGPVGLVRGELVVAGTIRGDVVLLDADLRIRPGGRIEGDVLIVGGRLREGDETAISGLLTQYGATFRFIDTGDEFVLDEPSLRARRGVRLFGSRFTVRAGTNYNRVEGLPVLLGPVIESSGSSRLRFEGLATFRTETGFTDDALGFQIDLQRRIGSPTRFWYGVGAYSEVTPIESWGLGDLEASLATFLLHRDYRDYYERHGWQVQTGYHGLELPLRIQLAYRDEKHFSLPVGSPWSLRRNEEPWRPLPLVAEGDTRLLDLRFQWDERNDPDDPTDGWLLDGRVLRSVSGDLSLPAYSGDPEGVRNSMATPLPSTFTTGFLDLRRYARVDPVSDLRIRTVLGGTLTGDELPPQFQHALGGEGSLPGYSPFEWDCGARSEVVFVERPGEDGEPAPTPTFRRYGCDRFVLFQAMYRHRFDLGLKLGPDDEEGWDGRDWNPRIDLDPALMLFFDAGRGWAEWEGGPDIDDRADLGLGLELGSLGAYLAWPLNGSDRELNFFVRLQRRF